MPAAVILEAKKALASTLTDCGGVHCRTDCVPVMRQQSNIKPTKTYVRGHCAQYLSTWRALRERLVRFLLLDGKMPDHVPYEVGWRVCFDGRRRTMRTRAAIASIEQCRTHALHFRRRQLADVHELIDGLIKWNIFKFLQHTARICV